MACEHTYDPARAGDLLDFITAHYPDDAVGWTLRPMDSGEVDVHSTDGARFIVRPGQRVRWAPNSIPGGRFEVRSALIIG